MNKDGAIKHYNAVKEIEFINLKGLRDVKISLKPGLNCIIGANGTGKSTILHALACIYQKASKDERASKDFPLEYKLSKFFTPYSGTSWEDSKFTVRFYGGEECVFSKSDRWLPRREYKRKRDTLYLGISTGVPSIERENRNSIIRLSKQQSLRKEITQMLNRIMGENYTDVFSYRDSGNKEFLGISRKAGGGTEIVNYCSLSLSAGTQRCLEILRTVWGAKSGSLILVEELDMLLHVNALQKLVLALQYVASENNLQIVFTCHNPAIKNIKDLNFVCLQKCGTGITSLHGFLYYNVFEITGQRNVKIKLYCEDVLSQSVVRYLVREMKISHMTQIEKFGTVRNAFVILSGLYLMNMLEDGLVLAVLDGDVLRETEELSDMCKNVLAGCDTNVANGREVVMNHVTMYDIPAGYAPELYILKELRENKDMLTGINDELLDVLLASEGHADHHEDFREAFEKLGYNEILGCDGVVALFAKTPNFSCFVSRLRAQIENYVLSIQC